MLILVGVTVAVALNGGLFKTTKNAAESYEIETIREQAEALKSEQMMKSINDENEEFTWESVIVSINNGFENSTKNGNVITTADGKYDIRINDDYTIEVAKAGELEDTYAPIGIISDYKAWTYGGKYQTNLWFSANIDKNAYLEYYSKCELAEEEYKELYDKLKESLGEPYNTCETYEEMVIYSLNNDIFVDGTYTSLEECLQNDTIKELNITKIEQLLYYYYCYIYTSPDDFSTDKEMTLKECLKREVVETLPTEEEIEVEIINPDGEKVTLETNSYNEFFQIKSGHPISKNGEYKFKVMVNGILCGRYKYTVTELDYSKLGNEVSVGDYVAYNAGSIDESTGELYKTTVNNQTFTANSDIKWRVLVKTGPNVILVSETPIYDDSGNALSNSYRKTANYQTTLADICSIYGHGKGASEARSMSKADITSSDSTSTEYKMAYKDVNDENVNISYLLSDSRLQGTDVYNSGTYTYYYSYINNSKISEGRLANGGFEGTLNPQYKEYKYKITGAIRPIIILDSNIGTNGQDANGVWQLSE